MNNSIIGSLDKLISNCWTTYCGVLIERSNGKYIALGKPYNSLQEAKEAIENGFNQLAKTIK